MPKSQLEQDIERATNENVVNEDWSLLLDIVDRINQTNSEKEAIRIIMRRLNARDPHISMNTMTLLKACVSNCTRNFKLEVCSREFIDELRQQILKKRHPKLSERLAYLVHEWANEKDFKNDPALALIPSLYAELKRNGVEFRKDDGKPVTKTTVDLKKEEDDIAKAIQLSLKESTKQPVKQQINDTYSSKMQTSSLYGTLPQQQQQIYSTVNISHGSSSNGGTGNDKRRVKALYDFEAAEENELTFKAGDILLVIDDSDPNWWKGTNFKQEGLFPSNFVTPDLNAEIESFNNGQDSSRKVTFNDEISVKTLPAKIVIDERRIDDCIQLIQDADPTGEVKPDSEELLQLEDTCYAMGPLIDLELQQIDQKHSMLEDVNVKLLEAFQMYHNLMKESLLKQNVMPSAQQQQQTLNYGYNSQTPQPQYSLPPQQGGYTSHLPPQSIVSANSGTYPPTTSMAQMPPGVMSNPQYPIDMSQSQAQQYPPLNYPPQPMYSMPPQQTQAGQIPYQQFNNLTIGNQQRPSQTNDIANSLNDYATLSSTSLSQIPIINAHSSAN